MIGVDVALRLGSLRAHAVRGHPPPPPARASATAHTDMPTTGDETAAETEETESEESALESTDPEHDGAEADSSKSTRCE